MWVQLVCVCVCTQELTLCVPCLAVGELGLDSNTCLCIGGVCEGITSMRWCVLQGGGVYINGGTVSFTDTQIYSNTATVSLWLDPWWCVCVVWEQLVCVCVHAGADAVCALFGRP